MVILLVSLSTVTDANTSGESDVYMSNTSLAIQQPDKLVLGHGRHFPPCNKQARQGDDRLHDQREAEQSSTISGGCRAEIE